MQKWHDADKIKTRRRPQNRKEATEQINRMKQKLFSMPSFYLELRQGMGQRGVNQRGVFLA